MLKIGLLKSGLWYFPIGLLNLQTLTQSNIYGVNLNKGVGSQQIFINLKKYYKKNGEKFHLKLILNLLKVCHIELKHVLGIKDGLHLLFLAHFSCFMSSETNSPMTSLHVIIK